MVFISSLALKATMLYLGAEIWHFGAANELRTLFTPFPLTFLLIWVIKSKYIFWSFSIFLFTKWKFPFYTNLLRLGNWLIRLAYLRLYNLTGIYAEMWVIISVRVSNFMTLFAWVFEIWTLFSVGTFLVDLYHLTTF